MAELSAHCDLGVPPSERAVGFAAQSLSARTRREYEQDWARFTAWCTREGLTPLPADPQAVANYLSEAASLRDGERPVYSRLTLARWLSGINAVHHAAGVTSPGGHPSVKMVMSGISRVTGTARPIQRRRALSVSELEQILQAMPAKWPAVATATRDRSILLVGFAGAFRRSELTALSTADLTWHPQDGVHVRVRSSKTDQHGVGMVKAIPYGTRPLTCPVCALARWMRLLTASDRTQALRVTVVNPDKGHQCRDGLVAAAPGPLFPAMNRHGQILGSPLSGHAINTMVKTRAQAAGVDALDLGAHSLRAGFVTQASRNGATYPQIMRQTGHRNATTVAGYIRDNDPLTGNAVTKIGL